MKREEEDCKSSSGEALSVRCKATALLFMMPMELRNEILKESHRDPGMREDYEKLRARCDDAIFVHTSGILQPASRHTVKHVAEDE